MRTLLSKYLSEIPVEEHNYKADFAILEKYQAFSSEILRLSLLVLAVYGFLLTNLIFKVEKNGGFILVEPFYQNRFYFLAGALLLIAVSFCALGHRYYSTDCMTHFVRGLRLKKKFDHINEAKGVEEISSENIEALEKKISGEKASLENDLNKCKWLLIIAGSSFILGVLIVIVGIGLTLSQAAFILK